jgi:hypothetical protein
VAFAEGTGPILWDEDRRMNRVGTGLVVLLVVVTAREAATADKPKRTPKEALQAFNDLIGSWRGTGLPEGTREEKQRGFWTETLSWEWQFKGPDVCLTVAFDKGKHFVGGELHYLPDQDKFQLNVTNTAKESLTFTGPLKERVLTLEREDAAKKETQRLVITLLHANRFLYRFEVKPAERLTFTRLYQVGATKEGVPFASEGNQPECVVSGGLGTSKVSYKGKDYYVCCSGCRAAFKEDPEKYIKEFEERKAKEAKEKKSR